MDGGAARRGPAPSDSLFALATIIVAALGVVVFQSFAVEGEPAAVAIDRPIAAAQREPVRAVPSGAEVALSQLVSSGPALLRAGPRVLSQATGMTTTAPISLRPGLYELWLGCVGDGRVRLSIFAGSAGSGSDRMQVVERDCVAVQGIYDPQAVDPAGEFPAFHPPDSAGLRGREGSIDYLAVPDDRFQTATVQLSALSAQPVTAAWRLSGQPSVVPPDQQAARLRELLPTPAGSHWQWEGQLSAERGIRLTVPLAAGPYDVTAACLGTTVAKIRLTGPELDPQRVMSVPCNGESYTLPTDALVQADWIVEVTTLAEGGAAIRLVVRPLQVGG